MSFRSTIALLSTSLVIAACSDSTGPKKNNPDLAALLGEMSSSSVTAVTLVVSPEDALVTTLAPAFAPGSCVFTSATGFFVCPDVTVSGLTFSRMFKLLDASNTAQSVPSAQTAAIEAKTSVHGVLTPTGRVGTTTPITINRSDDVTLSGVQSDQHTLNGTAIATIEADEPVGVASVHIKTTQTEQTTNLVLPSAKSVAGWPQSGTLHIEQTEVLTPTGGTALSTALSETITFNGSSTVTVTTSINGGTPTVCHVNLAAPAACVP
jgi:hypothetical protein